MADIASLWSFGGASVPASRTRRAKVKRRRLVRSLPPSVASYCGGRAPHWRGYRGASHFLAFRGGAHAPSRAAVNASFTALGAPARQFQRALARVLPAAGRSRTHAQARALPQFQCYFPDLQEREMRPGYSIPLRLRLKFSHLCFRVIAFMNRCRSSVVRLLLLLSGLIGWQLSAAPATEVLARVHWLGMDRIGAATNATGFMNVWRLPQTAALEAQTLDKLSLAPWRLLHRSVDTNAAALLRPLLDDWVAEESYLEIRQATNQPGELVFAIRLDGQRATLWQTNLARVLESLTGIRPVPAPQPQYGWSLKKHHDPNCLELTRAGGWIIVGAAEDHNDLVAELKSRIERGQTPLMAGSTNAWLAADLDPSAIFSLSAVGGGWGGAAAPPSRAAARPYQIHGVEAGSTNVFTPNHLHFAVRPDGANLLTQGHADFSQPLALDLKPWNVPTNLIDEHLSSFTLIRGLQPWLESLKTWNALQIGPPPAQVCFWALNGLAMQSYFAAPLPAASNEVDRFTDWTLRNQSRWFSTNNLAGFERSKSFNGLEWKGVPYMTPFLCSLTISNRNFVVGGGGPNPGADPSSLVSLPGVLNRTNLVYHDWEITGVRVEQWVYMGQFARLVSHKAQLPSGSPGAPWLKAIAPKLGVSVTEITRTGANRLSFTRKSSVGFTGIELNLLADWLESPQFPYGLHTFTAP